MGMGKKLALVAGVAAAGATAFGAATAQPAQKVTGPIAVYWMSAQTQTGFSMPAMGSGGRPDTAAMMRAMMGGGGASKTLTLQLGSSQSNAAPAAEHLPPEGLEAGPSLPLVSPKRPPTEPETPSLPREYQKPRGKMLIFWGCGEHARPGQPVVIDFSQLDPAKMQAGQVPPGLAALTKGFGGVTPMRPPSPSRNTTYGEWPNERTRTQVAANGSLVGEHTIQGNYSPQIRFTLKPEQDFLPPLKLTTNEKGPGGWVNLGWNAVDGAEGYLATAMGGGQDTVVMWTSSETQAAAFAMPDYLGRADIGRLVQSKALMAPTTRACAVPKEAQDAMAQGGVVQLAAYASDANFVYPPRPSDPKVAWNQQWAVKVRYRASTGGMLGMETPDMDGEARYGQQRPGQPPQQKPPSKGDILKKGILGGFGIPRP